MPKPLLQHTVAGSAPWKVVATSMLLCRTSGAVAEPVLETIFRTWPTARALSNANESVLISIVRPLGLQVQRARRLKAVGALFAETEVPTEEEVAGLQGVGPYVLDAYRIVVLGDIETEPDDKALKEWVHAERERRSGAAEAE